MKTSTIAERRWRLDGWDGRGGRAFASQREEGELCIGKDSPGAYIFVGPPSFEPEWIANSSIALAAARSSAFLPRVPRGDGVELAFQTARSVAEFVRRGFISGSRNRGGTPPLPEDTPPLPPVPPDDGGASNQPLDKYLRTLVYAEGAAGNAIETGRIEFGDNEAGASAVVRGAALVAAALLLSRRSLDSSSRTWLRPACALLGAIEELGMSSRSLDDEFGEVLWEFASSVQESIEDISPFWHRRHSVYWWSALPSSMRVENGYDAMHSWPLHPQLWGEAKSTTVGELLTRFVATPALYSGAPARVLDIVMFAAAVLGRGATENGAYMAGRAALSWLALSLPKFFYTHGVEALLAAVHETKDATPPPAARRAAA